MKPNTCILLFARTAKLESEFKRLVRSDKINLKVHKRLYSRTLKTLSRSGMPVLLWDESLQTGNSFGEKLSLAFEAAFDKGFQNVIAVGSDCPAMEVHHLFRAEDSFQQNQSIIGKTRDGGLFMIGLTKAHFKSNAFRALNWESQFLSGSIQEYFQSRDFEFINLWCLLDLDTSKNLYTFLVESSYLKILDFLKSIWSIGKVTHEIPAFNFYQRFVKNINFKASPHNL